LHNAAAHLLVDQQRIDDAAAILDAPMLEEVSPAPVSMSTSRWLACTPLVKAKGNCLVMKWPRLHELARQIGRQRVAAEVDDAANSPSGMRTAPVALSTILPSTRSRLLGAACSMAPATLRAASFVARPACRAASPPMPAPRQAQVPPP
jgi:hypothetical protein